jgi:hypothetical protein
MTHYIRLGPLLLSMVFMLLSMGTALGQESGDKPAPALDAKEMEKLWEYLASDDAAKAFKAMGKLAGVPDQATVFLKTRLKVVPPADPKVLQKLLEDLNSDQYAIRQKASAELERLADLAGPALREKVDGKISLEMRKRIEALLDKLDGPITLPELLRSLRTVELLELIGTPAARDVVAPVAKGAPGHRLTEAAQGAVSRLDKRLKPAPKQDGR